MQMIELKNRIDSARETNNCSLYLINDNVIHSVMICG